MKKGTMQKCNSPLVNMDLALLEARIASQVVDGSDDEIRRLMAMPKLQRYFHLYSARSLFGRVTPVPEDTKDQSKGDPW